MILGIAPGAMGFQARTQASISHRVRAERPLRRNNFPGNGRRAVGRPYSKFRFPAHAQRVSARMLFLLFRVRSKNATASPFCARRRVPGPTGRKPGFWAAGWVPGPLE